MAWFLIGDKALSNADPIHWFIYAALGWDELKRVSLCKEIQFKVIAKHSVSILNYRNVFLQIKIFNDIFQQEK